MLMSVPPKYVIVVLQAGFPEMTVSETVVSETGVSHLNHPTFHIQAFGPGSWTRTLPKPRGAKRGA